MSVTIPKDTSKNEYFQSLEWLRFLLAMYIAVFHTLYYPEIPTWVRDLFEMSYFATSTFFVLSGFLLSHIYLDWRTVNAVKLKGRAGDFLVKRLSNLYPIHLIALALLALIALGISVFPVGAEDLAFSLRKVNINWGDGEPSDRLLDNLSYSAVWLSNVLLVHAWNPLFLSLNIPSWSISALLFFYLVFPYAAPRLASMRNLYAGLVCCFIVYLSLPASFVLTNSYDTPFTGIIHRNPIARIPEFLSGVLLCALYHRSRLQGYRLGLKKTLAMLAAVAAGLVAGRLFMSHPGAFDLPSGAPYYLLHNGLLLPFQLMLLWVCIHLPNEKMGNRELAARFGNASLTIFVLHVPINMIFSRVDQVFHGHPMLCFEDLMLCLSEAGSRSVWWYPAYLLVLVIACMLAQSYIVNPIREWLVPRISQRSFKAVMA